MNDNAGPSLPPKTDDPPDATSAPSDLSTAQKIQYAMAVALAASVLGLAVIGRIPVDTYINIVVIPGFAALGLHTVAKNLN